MTTENPLVKPWDMEPKARERFMNMWKIDPTDTPRQEVQKKYTTGKISLFIISAILIFVGIIFLTTTSFIAIVVAILVIIPLVLFKGRLMISVLKITYYQFNNPQLAYRSNAIFEVTACYLKKDYDVWIPSF